MEVLIRTACPEDAGALLNIYAYYVRETAVTFEYEVPSLEEFRGRMERTLSRYPYLVAMQEDRILGYACAGPIKERDAYDWSVETTIYLDRDARRAGIGSLLLDELEHLLKRQGILNVYACIGIPREEGDPYLTFDSMRFHEKKGYHLAGTFRSCGSKFGRWYDMIWMEKTLGDHKGQPAPLIPFPDLETFEEVDPVDYAMRMLEGDALTLAAVKKGAVLARRAREGETVDVWTGDGNLEGSEMAGRGDMILTRADEDGSPVTDSRGHTNSWIMAEKDFFAKYEPEDPESGLHQPAGGLQFFVQAGDNISFRAPWGEIQKIRRGGFLNITKKNDIYGIAREEFEETYQVQEMVGTDVDVLPVRE